MTSRSVITWLLTVALSTAGAKIACGQQYPSKPIRFVTTGIGSSPDLVARVIAAGISSPLGKQVIVDNRVNGSMPGEIVSKALPDGYTLLVTTSILWVGPLVEKSPYDAERDFSPITLAVSAPNILVLNPSLAPNSVKELIALAKAKPGQLNYGVTGTGGAAHLAAELFKFMAGIDMVGVNYKSAGAASIALISGEVQLKFSSAPSVMPQIKTGRLKALAITSAQPSMLAPGLPTMAASGLPGYESVSMTGVFAPTGTAPPLIKRLNHEIVAYLNRADTKQKFLDAGAETVGNTPEQFAAVVKTDIARLEKMVKSAGIRVE